MGEMISFAANGIDGEGYLALPTGGSGPGVVVIQEWWGLVDHIKDLCDRFAGEGFVALAPDLYHGRATTEPDEAQKEMMAMRMGQAVKDISGAIDEVSRRSGGGKVGVVGFCMGGGLALVAACDRPDKVAAVVPFYGAIPWPDARPDYSRLQGALQGHYASDDDFAGPEVAMALQEELRSLGKRAEVFVYPGTQHAFFNDTRPEVYDASASAQAWARTLEFLRTELA